MHRAILLSAIALPLLAGCNRMSVPGASTIGGPSEPTPSPLSAPAQPGKQGPHFGEPSGMGNAEPYNGPRVEGISIPAEVDESLSSWSLKNTAADCLEMLNANLASQLLGDKVTDVARGRSTELVPDTLVDGGYALTTRATLSVRNPENGIRMRLSARADLGFTLPFPSRLSRPTATFVLEPDLGQALAEPADAVKAGGLWFEAQQGLPMVLFTIPGETEKELKPLGNRPVDIKLVLPRDEHGPAVPLVLRRWQGKDSQPTGATINTEEYAQCVNYETQTANDDVYFSPEETKGAPRDAAAAKHFAALIEPYTRELKVPAVKEDGSTAVRSAAELRRWEGMKQASRNIFDAYFAGKWSRKDADAWAYWCGKASTSGHFRSKFDCPRLTHQLSQVFQEKSIQRFEKEEREMPGLKKLLDWTREQDQAYRRFRLGLRLPRPGFHRGSDYVAMDLNSIPPEEWDMDFVHENIHAQDPILKAAIHHFAELEKQVEDHPEDLKLLEEYLTEGLHRGLLAEWRAWVVTLHLYHQGLRMKLWKPVPKLERIFEKPDHAKMDLDALKLYVFHYLDARFQDPRPDPESGPLGRPEAQKLLKELRERLRNGQIRIQLGALSELVENEN